MIEIYAKRLFDGAELRGPSQIAIDGDEIVSVTPWDGVAGSGHVIDFLAPGLIDAHVHITGYREGTPGGSPFEPHKSFLRICALAGVTTVRDLGNTLETIAYCREWSDNVGGPRIISAGPLLDMPPLTWAFSRIVRTREDADRVVERLAAEGVEWIKAYRNIEPEVLAHIVAAARNHGLPTAADLGKTTGAAAAEMGITSYEHAANLLADVGGSWQPEMPTGLAGAAVAWAGADLDGPEAAAVIAAFKASGTWLCPTLLVSRRWAIMEEMVNAPHLDYATLVMPYHRHVMRMQNPVGMRIGKRVMTRYMPMTDLKGDDRRKALDGLQNIAHLTARMQASGVNVVAGTDAPNPALAPGFGLHEELHAMREAGISALDVLRSATGNAARLLGRKDVGVIAPGARADLLCLQRDPSEDITAVGAIEGVMIRGAWVDRQGLKQRLAKELESMP